MSQEISMNKDNDIFGKIILIIILGMLFFLLFKSEPTVDVVFTDEQLNILCGS